MIDESFCIEFASSLALILLELNAELLELAEEASNVTAELSVVELERACWLAFVPSLLMLKRKVWISCTTSSMRHVILHRIQIFKPATTW